MVTQQLYTNIEDPSLLFIENVLLSCFEDFKNSDSKHTFENYKKELESTDLYHIFSKYPVAKELLKIKREQKDHLFSIIYRLFSQDMESLDQKQLITKDISEIKNIQIGVGDFHKGKSTAIVELGNCQKIVFKPTKFNITESFFKLLDWVNQYYSLGDYRYKVGESEKYHWLEFVDHISCHSQEEVQIYYERAGFILGILYVLNAVDFHYENIIARGATPVIIDHETIIQPKIHFENQKFFKKNIADAIDDSVLSTMLLPNHDESGTGMPIGTCGYGYHKEKSIKNLAKESTDRYTDNWRFVIRFVEESFQKQNIPTLHNEAVYPIQYLEEFVKGFEKCYQILSSHREFLLKDQNSPFSLFNNNTIRYIWRNTNLYTKVNEQMKLPKNLVSFQHYEQKIHDYLAVAFKNVPKDSDLMLIHKHEVAQMLKGDIPFFEVNTSSRDLETDFGIIKDFFELSAVENFQRKLKKLSLEDLEIQKKLIQKSFLS